MKKIVYKNDGEIPVEDILCTTYQMRNFYTQFRDAYASNLDVMNYIQHLSCAQMCKEGWTVSKWCNDPVSYYSTNTILGYYSSEKIPPFPYHDEGICNKKPDLGNPTCIMENIN